MHDTREKKKGGKGGIRRARGRAGVGQAVHKLTTIEILPVGYKEEGRLTVKNTREVILMMDQEI